MSKVIYKYELFTDRAGFTTHEGYQILDVQMQRGTPMVWVLVDSNKPIVSVVLNIYGTGHSLPHNPGKYITTFQVDNDLVFHVFEGV